MGVYVNPKTMSKEEWLFQNGRLVKDLSTPQGRFGEETVPTFESFGSDNLPVVLVDNGPFTAAAVAFCEREYKYFTEDPTDHRPKFIYTVLKDKLYDVSNLEDYLPKPKKTIFEKLRRFK